MFIRFVSFWSFEISKNLRRYFKAPQHESMITFLASAPGSGPLLLWQYGNFGEKSTHNLPFHRQMREERGADEKNVNHVVTSSTMF